MTARHIIITTGACLRMRSTWFHCRHGDALRTSFAPLVIGR